MTLYALAGELSYRFGQTLYSPGAKTEKTQAISKRVRVLGTGNASEDLIGYDTKGGDALADLFVIGDLFKSEVYQLAEFYKVPKSILTAAPSAGLYEGQTDQDELGFGYDELEPALASLHRVLARGVSASDEEVAAAVAFAYRELKLVVEPGGAVGLAGLLNGRFDAKGKNVVIVLSGGNVDADLFAKLVA